MINENIYNILYKKISPLIQEIDPASLGGAVYEYDNEINQIIRFIMLKKVSPSPEKIKSIFSESYSAISLDKNELEYVISNINNIIKEVY